MNRIAPDCATMITGRPVLRGASQILYLLREALSVDPRKIDGLPSCHQSGRACVLVSRGVSFSYQSSLYEPANTICNSVSLTEAGMATPAKKVKLDSVPATPVAARRPCPYGSSCYRKNPAHFVEFSHPVDSDGASTLGSRSGSGTEAAAALAAPSSADSSSAALPPCKYGAKCYRKNLLHFAEYAHPTSGPATSATAAVDSDSDSDSGDTDVYDSDDDKVCSKGRLAVESIVTFSQGRARR